LMVLFITIKTNQHNNLKVDRKTTKLITRLQATEA